MANFLIELSAMGFGGSPPTFLPAHSSSFFYTHRSLSSLISQQTSPPVIQEKQ
jgi:hypothetical protein